MKCICVLRARRTCFCSRFASECREIVTLHLREFNRQSIEFPNSHSGDVDHVSEDEFATFEPRTFAFRRKFKHTSEMHGKLLAVLSLSSAARVESAVDPSFAEIE